MEAIEGEVVDPGKVIICEPGRRASARAEMDRRGEYGGKVEESIACPTGNLVVVDTDRIEANLGDPPPFQLDVPNYADLGFRLKYIYGATLTFPRRYGLITGT